VGALHLNGTTERHERDACEGCATRDTRLAAQEVEIAELRQRVFDLESDAGAAVALLSRSG